MDKNLEVDVRGAVAKLKKSGINIHIAIPKIVSRLMMRGERFMRMAVPIDTGYLRGSIQSRSYRNHAMIKAGAEYASHVNYGTRPHIIRPKTAKVLAFPIAGKIFFAKEVHHPGTKGKHFLKKTQQHILRVLPIEIDIIIYRALKGMTK